MSNQSNQVQWCQVCEEYYSDSRIDVLDHLNDDHTLSERLGALVEKGQRPEHTNDS